MIHRQVDRRAALFPGEINLRLIPHQHRISLQFAVAEVFALPAAERLLALPPETHHCHAGALEIVDLDCMTSCAEGDINRIRARRALIPFIQHENPVDEEAEAVIDFDVKAIDAGLEADRAAPADAEMIHGQDGIRRALAPIEEDHQIVACKLRRAGLGWIVPIFATPVGDDERRRRWDGRVRRRRRGGRRQRRRGGRRWRVRWRGNRFLRYRCLRRSRSVSHFNRFTRLAGAEERGRLLAAIGRIGKYRMLSRVQPARADRVEKAGADLALCVRGAGGQNAAAPAFIAQRDQHQAARRPAFANNQYIDARRA